MGFFFCVTLGLHIFLLPIKSNLLDFLVDDFYLYEAEEVGTFIINVLKCECFSCSRDCFRIYLYSYDRTIWNCVSTYPTQHIQSLFNFILYLHLWPLSCLPNSHGSKIKQVIQSSNIYFNLITFSPLQSNQRLSQVVSNFIRKQGKIPNNNF